MKRYLIAVAIAVYAAIKLLTFAADVGANAQSIAGGIVSQQAVAAISAARVSE